MGELHSHCTAPLSTVREVLDHGLRSLLVPRLSSTASRQLAQLERALSGVTPIDGPDTRSLPLCASPNGKFQTSVLYHLCTLGGEVYPHHKFVWQNAAPSKVRFFAWLLLQGRIQCRSNLLLKGILTVAESSCPICAHPLEDASRIMFECSFAHHFWSQLGAGQPKLRSVADAPLCNLPPSTPAHSADTLRLLCLWHLWKHRNGVVFKGLQPSLAVIRRHCREDAALWRVRLPKAWRSDTDVWLSYFPPNPSV
ncbi:unnamed protein product [Alopecurus aequalis]